MEPRRPVARRLLGKPLGDCTNTISRNKQESSSSSSVKFANPSLNNDDVVNNSNKASPGFAPKPLSTVRRKAASGRKRSNHVASSSSSAVATSLRLDFIPSPGKKRRQANENTIKPSKVAPIKRQRTAKHEEDNSTHGLSQDFIEKQRAYFAEIDAYELAEEEVSSSDLD